MTGDRQAASPEALETTGFVPAPGHILSEQIVIGTAAQSQAAVELLADIVRPDHFFRPAHGVMFTVALRLAGAGKPVDAATMLEELHRLGDLQTTGGGPYLYTCIQAARAGSSVYHARKIARDYQRRHLHAAGVQIIQLTGSPEFDPDTGFDRARQVVDDALAGPDEREPKTVQQLMQETLQAMETAAPRGLTTGYTDLDAKLTGLAPGEMDIVAARPSVGKSVVGLNIAAWNAIVRGLPVLFSSMEMRADELLMRLISAEARVPLSKITDRKLDMLDWERIGKYEPRISGSPLVIDDTPGQSLTHIRSTLRRMARKPDGAAQLLVIDYLGLIQPVKAENRQVEVAAISRGLKLIARDFDIPVLALHQLNRSSEQRSDHRPMLSDLRESGQIEADADKVILLHREDIYDRESPKAGEIDFIIAKQRQGPTCTVTLAFQGAFARCMDMAA